MRKSVCGMRLQWNLPKIISEEEMREKILSLHAKILDLSIHAASTNDK
jgi:hypothetical protein